MPSGVYKRTEYHRLINSNGHKGHIPWNKGTKGLMVTPWNKGMTGLPARHTTPHTEETKLKISLAKKGVSIKGHPVSEEMKLRIRNTLRKGSFIICKICEKSFFCSPSYIKRGRKYCSNKCQGIDFRGEKNPLWNHKYATGANAWNWKGGISPINDSIRKSKKYITWRRTVFIRDEFTCRECRKIHIYIQAHHIKAFADYPKLRFDVNNGLTLCEECHSKTENYKGKNKGVNRGQNFEKRKNVL